MNSFFAVSILAILFLQSPAQERDLSGYEKMEHTIDGTKESSESYLVKEREFIWNCWKQKRRCFAYLKVELKDTPPSVVQIYVEEIPDEEVRTADTYRIYLKSSKSAVKQGFELFFRRGGPGGLIF